jgi:hypothetical protein
LTTILSGWSDYTLLLLLYLGKDNHKMAYELLPTKDNDALFFRLDKEIAERYRAIGYLRVDFGKTGYEFWSTWFDIQPELNTNNFKLELDDIINSLREDGKNPPFMNRNNLRMFNLTTPGKDLNERGSGYIIRTLEYTYYFRCKPCIGDYDVYCFAYDNRLLLPLLSENKNKDKVK